MRYLYALLLSTFAAASLGAQGFSITNYQLVSQQQVSAIQNKFTYRADLVNPGAARTAATAGLTSLSPNIQIVPGQNTLIFSPVPGQGQVTSNNTFSVLVNAGAPVDLSQLQWTFLTPIASAGPNQYAKPGATIMLNGTGSSNPSGAGNMSYYWTFKWRPPGTSTVLFFVDSPTPFFTVDVPGTYIVALTVSNGLGSDTTTMTVTAGNSQPIANAGPNQTVVPGATVHLNGGASSDVDGDSLSYSWSMMGRPIGSTAVLAGSNTISPAFVADKAGSYVVQLVVSDGSSNSQPSNVTITTQNTAPVADAGLNQVVSQGAHVQLDGSKSSDVDGDGLTYSWTLLSRPLGSSASLSSPTAVNPTFTADAAGSYIAQLTVNDGQVASAPANVTITTGATQPPIANAGLNQTISHNTTVTLQGGGSDPQNMALLYQWSLISKPIGSNASLSTMSAANTTFFADKPGVYVAQLIVTNGVLPSPPSTVMITTMNSAPVASAGPAQNVIAGTNVSLDGSASSDADHDSLTYSWSFTSRPQGSVSAIVGPNSIAPSFIADLPGAYVVQLIVNDGYSSSNPSTVLIIAGSNSGLNVPANITVPYGQSVRFSVGASSAASASGIFVTLASSDNSTVMVSPSFILIPPFSSTSGVQPQLTGLKFGTAVVNVYAAGFAPATISVTVGANISFSPPSLTLAGGTQNLGLILSVPAPPSGLMLNLGSSNTSVVTVPALVNIPAGAASVTVPVTAVSPGMAMITASSNTPNIANATAMITVSAPGVITLPPVMNLGLGKSAILPVILSVPAPAGGLNVALSSSDPSKVTISPASVFIAAGAVAPAIQPQAMLVNFGSATITASASGYAPGFANVQLAATLTFWPAAINITGPLPQAVVLTVSAPAPAAGLTLNLHSDNPAVATVQQSISLPPGASQIMVLVLGAGNGSTLVHASGPGIPDATLNVTTAR